MTPSLRDFCFETIHMLKNSGKDFGLIYVDRLMLFYRTYKNYKRDGLFSSAHGPDFFQNVINGLNGDEHTEKGQYGDNFRKFIACYRALELSNKGINQIKTYTKDINLCEMVKKH